MRSGGQATTHAEAGSAERLRRGEWRRPPGDRPSPGPGWSRGNQRASPNDPPPVRRVDPGGRPSPSRTDPGASVGPGPPDAGEIRCDDAARTGTGPLRDKSSRTGQLVRDDPSDPPREGAGGDGPRGVPGVSPARRMRYDLLDPTSPEDPVTWDSEGRSWPRHPFRAPHALHDRRCKPSSAGRNRGGLRHRAAQRRGRPTPTIGPGDDRIGFRL
jgi:hypothetical protein